jgi:hypothetical protein
MAKVLKVKPADLMQLSAKTGGIFLFWDVYRTIDGRKEIWGHGPRLGGDRQGHDSVGLGRCPKRIELHETLTEKANHKVTLTRHQCCPHTIIGIGPITHLHLSRLGSR